MKIEDIKGPEDIKKLSTEELVLLSKDIREFLIESTSQTGGHLGSNLGIVELTTALHYVFNSPKDKLIFDVGHQGYVHKILTGRANQFATLRQYQGLSGFLKLNESEHDVWEAGHSSTSISAACGYAYARDMEKANNHVVAVIGDGSLTNGMALEALNHIAELKQNVIIVINDNEMSISSNVGYIANILKDLEYSSHYDDTKQIVQKTLHKSPGGEALARFISKFKRKLKTEINGAKSFFNTMGYKYYGPVDGHDYQEIIKTLTMAKNYLGPVIVHVKTEKGKGYLPAEQNQWHGVSPFDIKTGKPKKIKSGISYSGLVAKTIHQKMQEDQKIAVITPAMLDGSELQKLKQKFPNRVTDVGIAEEHAITFAGALALSGKKPFVSIYSTFLQRSYDQVFHDLVRQNTNVVIGIDRAGLVGDDGETHQGIYDISFLSHMPNITIAMGSTPAEIRGLLTYGFSTEGVSAIRYPRGGSFESMVFEEDEAVIVDTSWPILTEGSKKVVITYGPDVQEYNEIFKDNNEVAVVNARFIKPIDEKLLDELSAKELFIVEEHQRLGGLNSLINDYYMMTNQHVKMNVMAINDCFVEQGNVEILKKEQKIDVDTVVSIIKGN